MKISTRAITSKTTVPMATPQDQLNSQAAREMKDKFLFWFFLKSFWWTHVLFWGHWYPCFGFLVTSPLGFKARVGCLIRIAEVNVMYIPWDPPLVLHLPTSWQLARSQSCPHILLQRWGCLDSNSCSQNICEPDALPTKPGPTMKDKLNI